MAHVIVKIISHDPKTLTRKLLMRPLLVNPETSIDASSFVEEVVADRSMMGTNRSMRAVGYVEDRVHVPQGVTDFNFGEA
jgi:hypothetical protein